MAPLRSCLALALFVVLGAAPVRAQAADEMAAREAFLNASDLYEAGDFRAALGKYKVAYDLKPAPELLFNIGQCHYRMLEFDRAILFYRAFLRARPDTPHRAQVEGFIEEATRLSKDAKRFERKPRLPDEPVPPPLPPPEPEPAEEPASMDEEPPRRRARRGPRRPPGRRCRPRRSP